MDKPLLRLDGGKRDYQASVPTSLPHKQMNETTFQSLSIEAVAVQLGLSAIRQGAGLARLELDQDVLPHTINVDANTFHHESGKEGGPIEFVMAVRQLTRSQAIQWLKEEGKQKDERIEIIDGDVRNVRLAQDYVQGIAYYTVSTFARQSSRIAKVPYLITSQSDFFPCTAKQLQSKDIYYEKIPFPDVRWSPEILKAYLANPYPIPSLADCYKTIYQELASCLDFSDPDIPAMLTLWIMGTYCYCLFPSYPYIHLNGSAGCGKTKALQFISSVAFNGLSLSANTSPAAILRIVDANCPTCCIDEVESLSGAKDDDSRAVLAILNTGYKQGGGDLKCEQDSKTKQWIPTFYHGYCPKVLAGIRTLESTLASRCIPILMLRTSQKDVLNRELLKDEEFAVIRSMLYPAMLGRFKEIEALSQSVRSVELTGREWELWRPIITMSSFIDNAMVTRMRSLAKRMQQARRETDTAAPLFLGSLDALLIEDGKEENFYTTEDMYDFLSKHDESFEWLSDISRKSSRGKWLGNELRRCGVVQGKAELRSIDGEKHKGYTLNRSRIRSLLSAFESSTVTVEPRASLLSQETVVTVQ